MIAIVFADRESCLRLGPLRDNFSKLEELRRMVEDHQHVFSTIFSKKVLSDG